MNSDLACAVFAILYQHACMVLFSVLLKLHIARQRAGRTACGFLAAAVMLIGQPLIYASPSQTFGMTLSSMCASAALSILHIALMEPTLYYPTALQAVLAPTAHAVHGVMKIYKRMNRKHGIKHASVPAILKSSSSGKPLVVVDASGDLEVFAPKAVFSEVHWALLTAMWTWATVAVSYDVGLYILCKLSGDMCKGDIINAGTTFSEPVASWIPPQLVHVLQRPAVKLCLFSFAAGNLLPLAMDFIYCTARILVLLTAIICQWPDLGNQAAQMPLRAFNHPMAAKSITELWGFRWHQFLRFYFEGMACAAVDLLLPKGKQVPHAVRTSLRVVSAFLLSGIMHEYMTWAAYGTLTGTAMAFFGLHCAAILVENLVPAMMTALLHGGRKQRRPSTSTSATDGHPAADAQHSTAQHAAARPSCSHCWPKLRQPGRASVQLLATCGHWHSSPCCHHCLWSPTEQQASLGTQPFIHWVCPCVLVWWTGPHIICRLSCKHSLQRLE